MSVGNGPSSMTCLPFFQPATKRRWMQFVVDCLSTRVRNPADAPVEFCIVCVCVCWIDYLSQYAGVIHNGQNSRLKQGLDALSGVHSGEIPRNCDDQLCSGFCTFGCSSGSKQVCTWLRNCEQTSIESREPRINYLRMSQQDVPNTWLSDAVANGARVLTGLHVDTVLIGKQLPGPGNNSGSRADRGSSLPHHRSKRAVGVSATVISKGQQPHPRHPPSRGAKLLIR